MSTSDSINVTRREFVALQSDIDERFTQVLAQIQKVNTKINEVQNSQTITEFPDEEAQIREQWLSAFDDEIASFVADINTIKDDIRVIKLRIGLE